MASKPLTIMTDREMEDWEQFFVDSLTAAGGATAAAGTKVDAAATVAMFSDGNVLTGKHNASPIDLAYCAVHLLLDAIRDYIAVNVEEFRDIILGDDEEEGLTDAE